MRDRELQLIRSRSAIENPVVSVQAALVGAYRGVIFDMDGTLTAPGHLDFTLVRHHDVTMTSPWQRAAVLYFS